MPTLWVHPGSVSFGIWRRTVCFIGPGGCTPAQWGVSTAVTALSTLAGAGLASPRLERAVAGGRGLRRCQFHFETEGITLGRAVSEAVSPRAPEGEEAAGLWGPPGSASLGSGALPLHRTAGPEATETGLWLTPCRRGASSRI